MYTLEITTVGVDLSQTQPGLLSAGGIAVSSFQSVLRQRGSEVSASISAFV